MPSASAANAAAASFAALVAQLGYLSAADIELVRRAYRFADEAHLGQLRKNGEPYITHPIAVATQCTEWKLDAQALMAALMHDVMEDCGVTKADLIEKFGSSVAELVDGLTKLDKLEFNTREENQAESFRKMLLAMARDVRVILIKLADRSHNMRTLAAMPSEKQRRIAQEPLDIYAPLAHRFGMAKVRWELEDLAFKHLEPEAYKTLAKLVAAKRGERETLIAQMKEPLEKRLTDAGIADVEVTGRPKHLWSIYKKMQQRDRPYEDIYDLLAIRVIVPNVLECYHALGVIHDGWTPVQERIKDYIAQPKSNGYQSLHTTVFGPGRQLFEIQIRTRDMHRTADFGIAAHWLYKVGDKDAKDGKGGGALDALWHTDSTASVAGWRTRTSRRRPSPTSRRFGSATSSRSVAPSRPASCASSSRNSASTSPLHRRRSPCRRSASEPSSSSTA